jgi:hypothetical protein
MTRRGVSRVEEAKLPRSLRILLKDLVEGNNKQRLAVIVDIEEEPSRVGFTRNSDRRSEVASSAALSNSDHRFIFES